MTKNVHRDRFRSVFEALEQLEIRQVRSAEDREAVFALRYKGYRRHDYIAANDTGLCTDAFDDTPWTRLFGIYDESRLVATIRVHVLDSWTAQSPASSVYPEIVNALRITGPTIIDSSRFVIDPDIGWMSMPIHFVTTRISVLACEYFQARYSLSMCRPLHSGFYKRYFGFRQFGGERRFSGVDFPVQLMVCDVNEVRDAIKEQLPFLESLPHERRLLFDPSYASRSCYVAHSTAHLSQRALANRRTTKRKPGGGSTTKHVAAARA